MSGSIDTTQDLVLTQIAAHLREVLKLSDSQVAEIAGDPGEAPFPRGGDYFLVVAVADGNFDQSNEDGADRSTLTEEARIIVAAYTTVRLDRNTDDQSLLHDAKRGILNIKRDLLKAMVGATLTDEDGNTILRQPIHVRYAGKPTVSIRSSDKAAMSEIRLEFAVVYDWDLT